MVEEEGEFLCLVCFYCFVEKEVKLFVESEGVGSVVGAGWGEGESLLDKNGDRKF